MTYSISSLPGGTGNSRASKCQWACPADARKEKTTTEKMVLRANQCLLNLEQHFNHENLVQNQTRKGERYKSHFTF